MSKLEDVLEQEGEVRSMLCETCGALVKAKEELRRLESLKVDLQKKLTSLEVKRKELLGEIHIIAPHSISLKAKMRGTIVPPSLKEKFSTLSPEDKASIVAEMLEGLK